MIRTQQLIIENYENRATLCLILHLIDLIIKSLSFIFCIRRLTLFIYYYLMRRVGRDAYYVKHIFIFECDWICVQV